MSGLGEVGVNVPSGNIRGAAFVELGQPLCLSGMEGSSAPRTALGVPFSSPYPINPSSPSPSVKREKVTCD